jgi:hypothetical protein
MTKKMDMTIVAVARIFIANEVLLNSMTITMRTSVPQMHWRQYDP